MYRFLNYPKFFGDAMQQESRHPHVVGHRNAQTRSHLVLPLRGHHLGVRAADLHASVQTGAIVRLDHFAANNLRRVYSEL